VSERAFRAGVVIGAAGAAHGESVAYALSNGVASAVAVLGIMGGGFRAVAINLVAGEAAIGYALAHSASRLVIVDATSRALIESALRGPSFQEFSEGRPPPALLDVGELATREVGRAPPASMHRSPSPDDDALIMYTSGTTGRPKGVVLSHANLAAGGDNVARGHGLGVADRALCVLPLYHINGLCVTLMGPLVSGGSVVLPERFSSTRFWHWCAKHECTWFSVVPTQVSYLLQAGETTVRLPSLRFGRSASAPLAPAVHRDFESRFGIPLVETMGLTETAAQILSNPMPPGARRSGSPGLPIGCDIRVVDVHDSECPSDVDGELLVRGACVMRGYFRDGAATRAALTADGWLRTGDLGRRDADGFVFITGRLKELIIKGGENIAPREIDETLHTHPDVLEAAAFGRPCADYGERVEAAVALVEGADVDEATLIELCIDRLGTFKAPERVHVLDALPKGPSGKIQRRRVAEQCLDRRQGVSSSDAS